MNDMREQDHPDILKAMGTLANKKVICNVEVCKETATTIIDHIPLCEKHGTQFTKAINAD